jgi:hypothetical protein
MKQNVCSRTERTMRVIIGLVLLSFFIFAEGVARYWGLLGLVPIATVLFKYCPINHLLKIDTCHMKPTRVPPG